MADREFIAANALPVTEAEEVNVLVVDPATGELAQKAGANLGGGGEQADLVIALTMPSGNLAIPTSETTSVTIESGSLDAIVEAMRVGRPPIVKCKRFYVINSFDTSFPVIEGGVYDCDVLFYNGDITISFAIAGQWMIKLTMNVEVPEDLTLFIYPVSIMSPLQVI